MADDHEVMSAKMMMDGVGDTQASGRPTCTRCGHRIPRYWLDSTPWNLTQLVPTWCYYPIAQISIFSFSESRHLLYQIYCCSEMAVICFRMCTMSQVLLKQIIVHRPTATLLKSFK